MSRFTRKFEKKVGMPPGTLVHIGKDYKTEVEIEIIDYSQDYFEEEKIEDLENIMPYFKKDTITWINIDGVHELDLIEKIGNKFNIHPLVLEDIVSTKQHSRVEDHDDYIYSVLKMIYFDEEERNIIIEQVSLIIGDNYLISFQEQKGDVFDPVRNRIKNGKNIINKSSADYLAYALIDTIVDNYFVILEKFGELSDEIEEKLINDPQKEILSDIQDLKKNIIMIRKSVWYLREMALHLERLESKLIKKGTRIYFRDVYDHTVQVVETVETIREMIASITEIYLTSVNNKMSEVMKVLTIIATIFIPLTFIVGVYGMNFRYMPELLWHWGYFATWSVMGVIAIFMLIYFRRKKWI